MKTENINEIFELAIQRHKENNFKIAEELYKKILKIDPNHFKSLHLLGSLSAQVKDLNQAKKFLEKAIEIKNDYSETYYNLGNVLVDLEEIQKAINCFEKVIQINPNNADAHNNLGNLLKKLGKIQDAESCYKKAIKINPNYANAYNNLATIFQKYKNFQEAISLYEKTIQLNPNFALPYNNLGLIFHELEEYQKAINSYEKAIKIKPDYAEAYSNLGIIFKEMGNFEKAINCFKTTIKYKPDDLITLHYLYDLNKEILSSDLEAKIIQIINNKNCTKINLAYGNFLLSIYELQRKNYKNEFNFLIKGHDHYFESEKDNFTNVIEYWSKVVPEVKELIISIKSSIEIKKNSNDIKPIFIIGVPRCGSTLIEKVIASGDKYIPIGEETGIFHNVVSNAIFKNQLTNSNIDMIKTMIFEKFNHGNLIKEKNDYIFTDKSLENLFYMRFIKEIFPNAKVIYCKRNAFSSIISIIKNNLTKVSWAHSIENIFSYFDLFFNEIENLKKDFPNLIYELEYEKFLKNPEIESKKLLEYCNLPWNKKCLEFYKRKELISRTASKTQIRKAIYQNSINKYLPYKDFFKNHENEYFWFNFN